MLAPLPPTKSDFTANPPLRGIPHEIEIRGIPIGPTLPAAR